MAGVVIFVVGERFSEAKSEDKVEVEASNPKEGEGEAFKGVHRGRLGGDVGEGEGSGGGLDAFLLGDGSGGECGGFHTKEDG